MKLLTTLCLLAGFGLLASPAAEDPQPAPPAQGTNAPAALSPAETPPAPAAPAAEPGMATPPAGTNGAPAATTAPALEAPPYPASTNEWKEGDGLRLNFRGAALETVLDYLSEAAGFIIVLETQPRGRIDVWSNQPVSKEEAVNLLNTVLRKNGYAAIRNGRQLTIVNRDEAKTKDIPVNLGSDPNNIPRTDEMVTQVIPIRFVEATQLIRDLQPLVSTQTAMTANESGNSIVITDTQANIHRVAQIIRAIDLGAEEFTVVRVFKLNNSDPNEMADLLTSLFPDESRTSGGGQAFGGFRGIFGRGGPPGMGGNNNAGGSNSRIRKHNRVLAVPDQRTTSIIVSASQDLMTQIEGVISDLDQSEAKRQTVRVIPMNNADPEQTLSVLQDIFQKNTSVNNRNSGNRTSALENRSTQQLNQQNSSSRRTTGRNNTSQGMGR